MRYEIGLVLIILSMGWAGPYHDEKETLERTLKRLEDPNPWLASKAAYFLAEGSVNLDEPLKKSQGLLKERLEAVVKRRAEWKEDPRPKIEKEMKDFFGTFRAEEIKTVGLLRHIPDYRFYRPIDSAGKTLYGNIIVIGKSGKVGFAETPKAGEDVIDSWSRFMKEHGVKATSEQSALDLAHTSLILLNPGLARISMPRFATQEDSKWVVYFSTGPLSLVDAVADKPLDRPPQDYIKLTCDREGYIVDIKSHVNETGKQR